MVKIKQDDTKYTLIEAQTIQQHNFRNKVNEMSKSIKKPCCKICLDTDNLIYLTTVKFHLCEFCHQVQNNL
tara:strand:- start:209 stop:421 length:213 start_codon:yes stop_codon:yes gene_type:complete